MVHVALVEDDPHFHASLTTAIGQAADMQLSGSARSLAEGMALLGGEAADVMLVDLGLPDGSGIDLIRAVRKRWPSCDVMVVTVFGDETHVLWAVENGASGYLLKDYPPERIIEEVRNLASGGSPISPYIARQILKRFQTSAVLPAPALGEGRPELSERELEVLRLITKGFNYNEIANLLTVSRQTVLTYVRRIYHKLGVNSQTQAVFEARRHGILET
jgi:DNA-binding NarL/FixJ family response regulator